MRASQKSCAETAAVAKSLQSCPTLCNTIDGSPPGSPVPGILQARILEWVAISFSDAWKWKVKVKSLSRVRLFATPWTAAYQASPSMGFSRREYWSGVPSPSPIFFPLFVVEIEHLNKIGEWQKTVICVYWAILPQSWEASLIIQDTKVQRGKDHTSKKSQSWNWKFILQWIQMHKEIVHPAGKLRSILYPLSGR